ncbi:MAG TPA: hypothetical protein VLX91_04470 [Candidatus Acidoferrales bacterium]|nr:hypothetical protein [Candidatus Acidoferrales bacterium]
MKRVIFRLVLSLFVFRPAFSQNYIPIDIWQPFISVGYESASTGDVSIFYHNIVQSYRDQGIPVPTQTDFGRTLAVNGGFLYCPIASIWFGLSMGCLYSPAFSDYQDYAGTLKVDGSVVTYPITIITQYKLTDVGSFPILIIVKPGFSYFASKITQDLEFAGSPQNDFHSKISSYSWAFCIEAGLGTSVQIGRITATIESGYHLSGVGPLDYHQNPGPANDPYWGERHFMWSMGQSGFIVRLTTGFNL